MKNVAFIFSGRGSLVTTVLDAIRDSKTQSRLSLMITNNVEFDEKFTPKGVDLVVLDRNEYVKRNDFEKKIIFELKKRNISLVILGGFKFIFSEKYVDLFGNITINTHPSLLPAFHGDKAQQRALAKGVIYTGATIHFINEHVDDGPIIDQEVVRVEEGMTEYELKEQIIEVEKIMIYRSVKAFLDGRLYLKTIRLYMGLMMYKIKNDILAASCVASILFVAIICLGLSLAILPLFVNKILHLSPLFVGGVISVESISTLLSRASSGRYSDKKWPQKE